MTRDQMDDGKLTVTVTADKETNKVCDIVGVLQRHPF
jgi:hypothetical protein